MSEQTAQLTYRGRPLVRNGDEIYYGRMSDKYVIYLKISAYDASGLPSKILIRLQYTDPDIRGKGKIVKEVERTSLAEAMELASAWLKKREQG